MPAVQNNMTALNKKASPFLQKIRVINFLPPRRFSFLFLKDNFIITLTGGERNIEIYGNCEISVKNTSCYYKTKCGFLRYAKSETLKIRVSDFDNDEISFCLFFCRNFEKAIFADYIRSGADTPNRVSTLRSAIRAAFTNTRRAFFNATSSVKTRQLL